MNDENYASRIFSSTSLYCGSLKTLMKEWRAMAIVVSAPTFTSIKVLFPT